jgi:hypothetical protein
VNAARSIPEIPELYAILTADGPVPRSPLRAEIEDCLATGASARSLWDAMHPSAIRTLLGQLDELSEPANQSVGHHLDFLKTVSTSEGGCNLPDTIRKHLAPSAQGLRIRCASPVCGDSTHILQSPSSTFLYQRFSRR